MEDLRDERFEIKSLKETIKRNCLQLFEHIMRMGKSECLLKATEGIEKRKGPTGRRRTTLKIQFLRICKLRI